MCEELNPVVGGWGVEGNAGAVSSASFPHHSKSLNHYATIYVFIQQAIYSKDSAHSILRGVLSN